MWVEKNGKGRVKVRGCDSAHPISIRREPILAGLKALATYDFVDAITSLSCPQYRPAGGCLVAESFRSGQFIASETIGKSWYEYQLENTRRQLLLLAALRRSGKKLPPAHSGALPISFFYRKADAGAGGQK